ncbi:hypothetical protein D3C78_1062170 [compost metagenome]
MNAIQHFRNEERDQARREWLAEQVERLLRCEDADRVQFFSHRQAGSLLRVEGFADKLMEHMGDVDNGPECFVVQCLLAVGRGDYKKAEAIYDANLRSYINEFAEKVIEEAL